MIQNPGRLNGGQGSNNLARRRYQEGSIELRGVTDPVWTLRYTTDEVIEGRTVRTQRRVVLGTEQELPTKAMAKRAAEKFLDPVNDPNYRGRKVVKFIDFVDKWRTAKMPTYKPATAAEKVSQLHARILPFFGQMPIHEITTETMQDFITSLTGELSRLRIQGLVVTTCSILKMARKLKYTDERIDELDYPREEKEERPWFTVEQITAIIKAADEPWATLFHLLAETGIRIGEAFALRPEDLVGNVLNVRRSTWRGFVTEPKTKRGRRALCLSAGLTQRLNRFAGQTWMFQTGDGKPCRGDNIASTVLKPLLERLGLPQAGFHAFRHANATILDSMAVPTVVRQSRLGHANIQTTLQTYTHAVTADALNVATMFEGMFSGPNLPNSDTQVEENTLLP